MIVTPLPRPRLSLPVGNQLTGSAQDVTTLEAVRQDVLYRDGDITEAVVPPTAIGLLRQQRNDDLVLRPRAEAPFVQQFVSDLAAAGGVHRRRQHRLVLGERLFRHERSRHVELAARPRGIAAEPRMKSSTR
jgi:hypothetical protein